MKKKNDNKLKNRYLEGMGVLIIVLALVRCMFPGVAGAIEEEAVDAVQSVVGQEETPVVAEELPADGYQVSERAKANALLTMRCLHEGEKKHRILSVSDYQVAFPDTNALQLTAACHWGVTPVENRQDAERRNSQLVFIGSSPYYIIDNLTHSIPYLVPRAALLLDDLGRAFFDSLHVKGMPLHRFVVTSVLRSQYDVERLRKSNKNATEQSCHLYGTTFDISYTRFMAVEDPEGPTRRVSSNDSLKWVLAEVLRDARVGDRCYIKHEVKQPCFHITVR